MPARILMRALAALALLTAVLSMDPRPAHAQEVTLSVAISMKEVVEELGRRFMAARPGVTLRYNLGSSGELQKQIEAGAPIDLFISAAPRQMDELEKKGLVLAATRRVFARNVLIVVKPADSRIDLTKPSDLLDPRVTKIVIGSPKTVPVGQYGRRVYERSASGSGCRPSSCSRKTSARRSTTSRGARSTRASSTRPTPPRAPSG